MLRLTVVILQLGKNIGRQGRHPIPGCLVLRKKYQTSGAAPYSGVSCVTQKISDIRGGTLFRGVLCYAKNIGRQGWHPIPGCLVLLKKYRTSGAAPYSGVSCVTQKISDVRGGTLFRGVLCYAKNIGRQGWHPIPECLVLRKKWIIAMKRYSPYTKEENFVSDSVDVEGDLRSELMPSAK